MKTVLGPSWPKRSDIRLVFIKSDPPGNTGKVRGAMVKVRVKVRGIRRVRRKVMWSQRDKRH